MQRHEQPEKVVVKIAELEERVIFFLGYLHFKLTVFNSLRQRNMISLTFPLSSGRRYLQQTDISSWKRTLRNTSKWFESAVVYTPSIN